MNRAIFLALGFALMILLGQAVQIASYKDAIWLCYAILFIELVLGFYWWYNLWLCLRYDKWEEKMWQ
jgi:hypothetical protein